MMLAIDDPLITRTTLLSPAIFVQHSRHVLVHFLHRLVQVQIPSSAPFRSAAYAMENTKRKTIPGTIYEE
jgi:hypothetical protein